MTEYVKIKQQDVSAQNRQLDNSHLRE